MITGGENNTIQSTANHSSIIGGSSNVVNAGAYNSVVLGGSGIHATQPNTVYAPNLTVTGLAAGGLLMADNTGKLNIANGNSLIGLIYSGGFNPDPCNTAFLPIWKNTLNTGYGGNLFTDACVYVGIDGNTPTRELDVFGSAQVRGDLAVDNISTTSSNTSNSIRVNGSISIYDNTHGTDDISMFFGQANAISNTKAKWGIQYVAPGSLGTQGGLNFWIPSGTGNTFGNNFLFLADNGNIGIGTPSPSYPLDVVGTIRSFEVKVCMNGCDFVFDKKYNLMPVDSLNEYVKQNHHLPGIASAKQMEEEGNVSLGKMDSQLLQKVEELTLYMIQMNKELQSVKAENAKLKDAIIKK